MYVLHIITYVDIRNIDIYAYICKKFLMLKGYLCIFRFGIHKYVSASEYIAIWIRDIICNV